MMTTNSTFLAYLLVLSACTYNKNTVIYVPVSGIYSFVHVKGSGVYMQSCRCPKSRNSQIL